MIDDGDFYFLDLEIVVCLLLNLIEIFMFRFLGEFGCDEDDDGLILREMRIIEEEMIFVEERFFGFFMGLEVVICLDGNLEVIVKFLEEFDFVVFFFIKSKDEVSLRVEFKIKGF